MMNNNGGFLKSKNFKYGANSIVIIAVVVAIAVVVNILVGMLNLKMDLTPEKLYSIGDTTEKILNENKKDVTIYGLFDEGKNNGSEYKMLVELLDKYSKYPHISVKYIDPDKEPSFIKSIDPQGTRDFKKGDFAIVENEKKKVKKLSASDLFETQTDQQTFSTYATGSKAEQGFTGAIKYVTADKTPVVYFTEGHEEMKVSSDMKTLEQYLQVNNYDVKTINLNTQAKVPEDSEILIVASPKKDLTGTERDKIKEYLKNGGKAVFAFDSLDTAPKFTEFENVLAEQTVSLNYDKVKENDETRHAPEDPYFILVDLQTNEIIPNTFAMAMPKSRSINILKNQKEYIKVTSLIKTSDKAVGEQIDKSRGEDIAGPLDLAVAVENQGGAKPAKILVLGNGYFMSDSAMSQYGQYGIYFFVTALNWLQDQKDDVVIAPKAYQVQTINVTETQAKVGGIILVFALPLLILGLGTFVWMRRRHL